MPYVKRRRATRRRRARKSRFVSRSGGKRNASVSVGKSLITADRCFVKLKFHIDLAYSGTSLTYQFAGNGLYDPYLTGVGTQPAGFDEYSAFYARYRVYASKMQTVVVNTSSTVGSHSVLIPTVDSSAPSATDATELPYSKWWINPVIQTTQPKRVSSFMTTRKIRAAKKGIVALDDTYGASTAANPASQWYWNWVAEPIDGVSTAVGRLFFVITYYAEF